MGELDRMLVVMRWVKDNPSWKVRDVLILLALERHGACNITDVNAVVRSAHGTVANRLKQGFLKKGYVVLGDKMRAGNGAWVDTYVLGKKGLALVSEIRGSGVRRAWVASELDRLLGLLRWVKDNPSWGARDVLILLGLAKLGVANITEVNAVVRSAHGTVGSRLKQRLTWDKYVMQGARMRSGNGQCVDTYRLAGNGEVLVAEMLGLKVKGGAV